MSSTTVREVSSVEAAVQTAAVGVLDGKTTAQVVLQLLDTLRLKGLVGSDLETAVMQAYKEANSDFFKNQEAVNVLREFISHLSAPPRQRWWTKFCTR